MSKIKTWQGFTFSFLLLVGVVLVSIHYSEHKPKNEIRILIDRIPNTLNVSQSPDVMAKRIFPLLTEQHYRLENTATNEDFTLFPQDTTRPPLHFIAVREELSRTLLFLSGGADVVFDSISLTKTTWIKEQKKGQVIEAPGYNLSFLGLQYHDSILKDVRVRLAISLALPLSEWIHFKLFDWVTAIPEAPEKPDYTRARSLLDEAGFSVKADGLRFTLRYLTTTVREGNEMAFLVREALRKVEIGLDIQPLETSLFFDRLKRGDFQIFGARFFRSSASDSIADFLSPHGVRNYFQYDGLEEGPFTWDEVKTQVVKDLPLIPLFLWKHAAVLSDRIIVPPGFETKLDDSFLFLSLLTLK